MTKHAIILGIGSDIGSAIADRLRKDGWAVAGVHHTQRLESTTPAHWDLIVCCYGKLSPIGSFWDMDPIGWEWAFQANAFLPLRQVRELYPKRNPDASVCFFSGAGSGGPAPTYSAYAASKFMLIKMTELLDDESEDCKFFILGPGMVQTKIHQQTLEAGDRAANYGRVRAFACSDEPGTSMDDVYACLMTCVGASKKAVGGRNVCVGDDLSRLDELEVEPHLLKFRRLGEYVMKPRNALHHGGRITEGPTKTNIKTLPSGAQSKPSGPPPRPASMPLVLKGG